MTTCTQRKDAFYQKAKREGLSRPFGLQIARTQSRVSFFCKPGNRVIDLGSCLAGGCQVVAELVRPHRQVIGIDLVCARSLPQAIITLLQGDATEPRRGKDPVRVGRPQLMSCFGHGPQAQWHQKKSMKPGDGSCVAPL